MRSLLSRCSSHTMANRAGCQQLRQFSFSFAGPKKLDDVLKSELVQDKTGTEVADIWYTYHEEKVRSTLFIDASLYGTIWLRISNLLTQVCSTFLSGRCCWSCSQWRRWKSCDIESFNKSFLYSTNFSRQWIFQFGVAIPGSMSLLACIS